jgi:Ribonuclease G/E
MVKFNFDDHLEVLLTLRAVLWHKLAMAEITDSGFKQCPVCKGAGCIIDPPYEQQLKDAEDNAEKKWVTKKPCDNCRGSGKVLDD